MFPFTGNGLVSLQNNTATVRNQNQLLTCKTSKRQSLLSKKTTIFELSSKVNEMQYPKHFRALKLLKIYRP